MTEFVDCMYAFNYFDMAPTHTDNSRENTTRRMNALSQCGQQRLEIRLIDKRCVDNLPGSPEMGTSLPPVTTSDPEIPFISLWLHRRVVCTLGGRGLGMAHTAYLAHRPAALSLPPRVILPRVT